MKSDLPTMPFVEHLQALRRQFLLSLLAFVVLFAVLFFFAEEIFDLLTLPLIHAMGEEAVKSHRFIYTSLPEAFFTYAKLAFFGAAIAGIPVFLFQIWLFMAPGLYKNEKKSIRPYLIASPLLFYSGVGLAYFIIMPWAWKFFLGFEHPGMGVLPIVLEPKIEDYVSLVISLSLAFGICFQLPIFLMLLGRTGLIQSRTLRNKRRYAVLVIFILSAFLTPPDVLSQIALAVPLLMLYELTIYLMRVQESSVKKDDE